MNVKIKVIRKGKPLKAVLEKQLQAGKKLKVTIMTLGFTVRDHMKDVIKRNIKRPGSTGKLVNSITVEPLKDGWGVGNVSIMPIYWKAFNWGSAHMVGKQMPVGGFAPGNAKPSQADFRKGRWQKGNGNYAPIVKKPILATNFLESTVTFLRYKILLLLRGIR